MHIFFALLENILIIYIFVAIFLFLAQELVIFPRLVESKLFRKPLLVPEGIESFFVKTADGVSLEVWTNLASWPDAKNAAIIFHGNGETVEARNFMGFFEAVGIPSFTFDYRGTGRSSGWPSEKGLYLDAEGVHKAVLEKTGLKSSDLVLLGNSLGSGPASYLASKIGPLGLILMSGYAGMDILARKRAFYKYFWYTARYKLRTAEHVKAVKNSFVILAHGMLDAVIPFSHLEMIRKNIPESNRIEIFESKDSFHNGLYDNISKELIEKTKAFILESKASKS